MKFMLSVGIACALYVGAYAETQTRARDLALKAEQLFEQQKLPEAEEAARAALRADPKLVEAHLVLAMVAMNAGRFPAARGHFEKAAALKPDDTRILAYLASANFQEGRLKEAEPLFRRVLQLDARNQAAHYNLGLLLLQRGLASEAEQHFRFVLQAEPSDLPSRAGILESRLLRKDEQGAAKSADELDAMLAPADPERLRLAAVLDRYGAYGPAVHILEKVPEDARHFRDAQYDLAIALFRNKELDRAAQVLQSLAAKRQSAEVQNLLGNLEERRGNMKSAGEAFARAAELEPGREDFRFDAASFQLQHGDPHAALETFRSATVEFPKSWRMFLGLGAAQYLAGKPEDAAETLLAVVKLEPKARFAYSLLGSLYDLAGASQVRILEALETYLKTAPPDAAAYSIYGKILVTRAAGTDDYARARSSLERAIKLDPQGTEAYVQLASIALDQGRIQESRALLERAVRADPDAPEPHYRLAALYKRLGQDKEAAAEAAAFTRLKASERLRIQARVGVELRSQHR